MKLEMIRGTSKTYGISVTDANGDAYTLADGEELVFGLKQRPWDVSPTVVKAFSDQTDGVYSLELKPADTSDLALGKYLWGVYLQTGDGDFYAIEELQGEFVLKPNAASWEDV